MDVRVGLWRKMSAKELMLLKCGTGEDPFRVPWTTRRSNQSILNEMSPEYSLEELMLMLKLQYFGHLISRADSFEKTILSWCWERLKTGREGDNRGWDGGMASLTRWTWVWAGSWSWRWTGKPGFCSLGGHKESDMTEWLNWTEHWFDPWVREIP